jgi:hypothetical protein
VADPEHDWGYTSIIPEVPSTVTNLTVIMLAERIFQRAYTS